MDANTTPLKLKAALAAARGVLVVEAVWPALFAALLVAAGFLALVWFGVLTWLPDLLRFIVIGIFALAFLAALARLLRVRLPGEAAARRRLERDSGLDHAPLSTLADAPAGTDPVAHALFAEHRKRVLSGLKRLMPALPHSAVPRRDPLALRTPVLLLALVAALYAGPDRGARLAEAFRGWTPEESVPVRIDAWLAPPGYTARPPLVLIAATPDPQRFGERIEVPEGTLLVLRMSVADALATSVTGATEEEGTPGERRFRLMRDGALELGTGTPLARFVFAVRPDADPAIAFADAPGATEDGALSMRVLFEDDYGVTGAEAAMIFDLDARAAMLVEPPAIDLVLPANRRNGAAQTVRDLTAHPFAGLSVPMRLIARDAAENTATSAVETVFIPERRWREPLAHALVEQRRGLALDRTAQGQVVLALDALMTGAANFMADDTGTFLALRVVRSRLLRARSDDELRGVLDDLWDLAVTIEDGAVGLAAERLRQLQEQLAEALENNLPPDTIDALMEEMRQALSDFLQSLEERFASEGTPGEIPDGAEILDGDALSDLLDAIEDAIRAGDTELAGELMQQLNDLMNGMAAARPMPSGPPSPRDQAIGEALNQLEEMLREQQELMDETFRRSPDAQRPRAMPGPPGSDEQQEGGRRQPGESSEPGEDGTPQGAPRSTDELARDQGALQDRLEELMEGLRREGVDPGALGEAGEAMGEAQTDLGEGDTDFALSDQGEAVDRLREGMGDLQGQRGEGQGGGSGQATAQGGQRMGRGEQRGGSPLDPLGRQTGPRGGIDTTDIPIPDASEGERARRVIEEIRRRLGQSFRPPEELRYLERLLERFRD